MQCFLVTRTEHRHKFEPFGAFQDRLSRPGIDETLDFETELRIMRVSRELGRRLPVTVKSTFLGAHGIGPEYEGRPDDYIEFLARTVADGLTRAFGQQFFVETRAGAGGQIGVQSVLASPPDGYNFVITNITMLVFAPITNPKLGYNPHKDLTNIAYIGGSPLVLTVNPRSGIRTLDEALAMIEAGASRLGTSSTSAILAELRKRRGEE